jgi:hypothetical protein
MGPFLLGFCVGIGVLVSFAGWGWLVVRALRIRFETGVGANSVVGLALTSPVGAVLNWFHLITPGIVRAYILAGILLAAISVVMNAQYVRASTASAWAYFKARPAMAFGLLALVLISTLRYSAVVGPRKFHLQDDFHAYFVFPAKMLQTGQLGTDPFSERRIISSLGDKYFLDTFVMSFTGRFENLRLMDEGIGYLILLLLLAEMLHRRRVPDQWAIISLLTASLCAAPISNVTALYLGIAVLVMLFDLFARTASEPGLNTTALLALLLAGLCSLKTTFMPAGAVFFLSFFLYQLLRLPDKNRTFARAGFCLTLIVLLLLPWMVYSRWTSGTLFYPLFGKGYHGSRYGIYLLPTAHMGLHNVLAFLDGLSYTVGLVVVVQVSLVLVAFRRYRDERMIDFIVVLNLLIDFVVIGVGTGGVQMYRYSAFILFAVALFLLMQELGVFAQRTSSGKPLRFRESCCVILVLGMLLGGGYEELLGQEREWGYSDLIFSLRGRDIDTPEEVAAYRELQLAVPPGEKILARMDKNFLFDFRRNPIYVNDLPGGASLAPGIPIFKGPDALAAYLLHRGIRYLAYSYGDEATFSRAIFGDRLQPEVNIWIRRGAEIAFDFQDNALALGKSRKKLFDNGSMFVLDLETPASGNQAADAAAEVRTPIAAFAPMPPAKPSSL